MSGMSRWVNSIKTYGRDSLSLVSAVWNHARNGSSGGNNKRMTALKPVLLDQAKQSNRVANSILQIDKQVGLVRYYGVSEFLKRHFQQRQASLSFSSLPGGGGGSSGDGIREEGTLSSISDSSPTPNKATIAFMVTASMKEELKTRLGYEMDEIKSMTPLQASLILSYGVEPNQREEQLPILEQEYNVQREQEQQEHLEKIAKEEEKWEEKSSLASSSSNSTPSSDYDAAAAAATTTSSSTEPTSEVSATPSLLTSNSPGSKSRNVRGDENYDGFGDIWFEVTETNNNTGESTRVGLYLCEDEALLGKEVRQDIADRKNIDSTFESHRITKEEL